jgi:membrane protein required for colicin V production
LTQLDLFFIVFVGLTILASIRSGLLKTLLDIILVVLSVYFAAFFAEILSGSKADNLSFVYFFAVSWVVIYALSGVLSYLLQKIIKVSLLGPVDLFGGMVLGAVKGILILGVLVWVLESLPLGANFKNAVSNSLGKKTAIPAVSAAYNLIFKNLPENIKLIKPQKDPPFIQKDADKDRLRGIMPEIKEEAREKIIKEVEKIK